MYVIDNVHVKEC